MRKFILAIVGIVLVLIGIVGLMLPIMPGWVFIFAGLSLIAPRLADRIKRRVLRKFFKKEMVVIEDWLKLPVRAGFTTRHFELLLRQTDDLSSPANQKVFKELLSGSQVALTHGMAGSSRFVYLDQVHEANVAVLEDQEKFRNDGFYRLPRTDGVLTNVSGLTLMVMTADCLSIFIVALGKGSRQAEWVGLIHAGWRGTKEAIARKAYRLILERSKNSHSDVHIVFGPAIRADHYEVGPEFKERFDKKLIRERGGKFYFDLAAENKRQLLEAGALEKNILDLDICTVCENSNFYSFRKEQDSAGRALSLITKI